MIRPHVFLQYISVNAYEVEKTPEQNENVENFMISPILDLQEFRFETVNDSTNCISDTTEDEMSHPACSEQRGQLSDKKDDEPSHHKINGSGQPSWRGEPSHFENDPGNSKTIDDSEKDPSKGIA